LHIFQRAALLWARERGHKGSTLQRRLILFFALVVVCVILAFTLLLALFGITGGGGQAVSHYLDSELGHIVQTVSDDLGSLSLTGIALSETLSARGDSYFEEQGFDVHELAEHPEALEGLLAAQMPAVLAAAENNDCGGVFIVLDASVNPDAGKAEQRRAGLFVKKTQPVSLSPLTVKTYWLRGPAAVAREFGVELLGQWEMEYALSEIPFLNTVMDTARQNPQAALSRLYCWTGRLCLEGNSEEGILLCLPLRASDGTVYGVCGVEVSDRMAKLLYRPNDGDYSDVFSIVAPLYGDVLQADRGLMAGNTYLTGSQLTEELTQAGAFRGFPLFSGEDAVYGGAYRSIRLHPEDSPYAGEEWAVAVLMPEETLSAAVRGRTGYLFLIVGGLLIISLVACVFVSRHYLHPIHKGLSSIREQGQGAESAGSGILEIDDLFAFLAQKDEAHEAALRQRQSEMDSLRSEHEKARTEISRLAYSRKQEIDPDSYAMFLENLSKLTETERAVFACYLEGKGTKEIMALLGFKENTLKYHNKNIYSKLGVTSRRELLRFAAVMKQEQGEKV